ncbi:hypothetical protein K6025_02845 [Ehrlichia sp. JZT12]
MTKLKASIVFFTFFLIFIVTLSFVKVIYNRSPMLFIIGITTSGIWLSVALVNLIFRCIGAEIKVQDKNKVQNFEKGKSFGIFFPCTSDEFKKINIKDNIFRFKYVDNLRGDSGYCIVEQSSGALVNKVIHFKLSDSCKPHVILSNDDLINMKGSGLLIMATGDMSKFTKIIENQHFHFQSLEMMKGNLLLHANCKKSVDDLNGLQLILNRKVMPRDNYIRSTSLQYVKLSDILLYELFSSCPVSDSSKTKGREMLDWIIEGDGKLALFLLSNFKLEIVEGSFIPSQRVEYINNMIRLLTDYIEKGNGSLFKNSNASFRNVCKKIHSILSSVCVFPYFTIHENYQLNDKSKLSDLMFDDLKSAPDKEILQCIFAIASYQYDDSAYEANRFVKNLLCKVGCMDVVTKVYKMLSDSKKLISNCDLCLCGSVRVDTIIKKLGLKTEGDLECSCADLIGLAREYIGVKYASYISPYYEVEERIVVPAEVILMVGEEEKSIITATGVDVQNVCASASSSTKMN